MIPAMLAVVVLLFAPAQSEALAECGPGEERVVLRSDEAGGAAAACKHDAFWPWALGGAVGLTLASSWAWLAWLRWLPAMGLFTRLRQDRLLEHPLRAQLLDIVAAEPGIHYQALIQRTGRGQGVVAHHLSMLVRAGMLSSVRSPGHRSFFVKGRIDVAVMRGLALVKSDTAGAVLRAVAQRPGAQKRSIARELGCRESAVRYHLRRFEAGGLVDCADGVRLLAGGHDVLRLLPEPVRAPTRPPGLVA